MYLFLRLSSSHSTLQLTAFAFRDYVRFGFVDQGGTHNTRLLRQFSINTYAPTMLLFKEDTVKPVDILQVRPAQLTAHTIGSIVLTVIKHSHTGFI